MKKALFILSCVICFLLAGCRPEQVLLDYGTYFCEELNCYVEVYPVQFESSGELVTISQYRGWFFDQVGDKHELEVGIDFVGIMTMRRIVRFKDGGMTSSAWLSAEVKEYSFNYFDLKYRITKENEGFFEIDMESKDENGDKKFIFKRIDD